MHDTITGIPVDLLITGFGALCAGIGTLMIHEIRSLRTQSEKRGRDLVALRVMVKQVCAHLKLPFSDGGD